MLTVHACSDFVDSNADVAVCNAAAFGACTANRRIDDCAVAAVRIIRRNRAGNGR
jgi:hypothetical protein